MDGPETGHRSYTGQHTQGPATYREKPRIKKIFFLLLLISSFLPFIVDEIKNLYPSVLKVFPINKSKNVV